MPVGAIIVPVLFAGAYCIPGTWYCTYRHYGGTITTVLKGCCTERASCESAEFLRLTHYSVSAVSQTTILYTNIGTVLHLYSMKTVPIFRDKSGM